ncbi:hypothetical protein GGI16_008375, partial [Coemansia sp. S142-1]
MGIISGHHDEQRSATPSSPLHSMHNSRIAQDAGSTPQNHNSGVAPSLLASGKPTDSLSPPPSTAAAHVNVGVNGPIGSRPFRPTSLKIHTDVAYPPVDLPPQPMTAGVKPPSPFGGSGQHHHHHQQQQQQQQMPQSPSQPQSPACPPKLSGVVGPIVIKRTT